MADFSEKFFQYENNCQGLVSYYLRGSPHQWLIKKVVFRIFYIIIMDEKVLVLCEK